MENVRYYRGTIPMLILHKDSKKVLVQYLSDGIVGNKREGYKQIKKNDKDITLIRFCYKNKKVK